MPKVRSAQSQEAAMHESESWVYGVGRGIAWEGTE